MAQVNAYRTLREALAAAKRLANRTGRKVTVEIRRANPPSQSRVKRLAAARNLIIKGRLTPARERRLEQIERALRAA